IRRRFDILDSDPPARVRYKLQRGLRWLRIRAAQRRSPEERESWLDPAELEGALHPIADILGASASDPTSPVSLDEAGNPAKQRVLAAAACLVRFAAAAAPI